MKNLVKKKIWIPIVAAVILLAVLFVPIPKRSYDDGGTREYIALTYKIVDWNKIYADGKYEKTCIYFGSDRNKSIDELWELEYEDSEQKFVATVLEINDNSVLVQPVEGEDGLISSDEISFGIEDLENIGADVGRVVEVTYIGGIMESDPAQIHATGWKIRGDMRDKKYIGQWLNTRAAMKYDEDSFDEVTITKIYSNCFFARSAMPLFYEIKFNGALSEEWCAGDRITCTYENAYVDMENLRVEADMLTVEASDWQPHPDVAYKPVIYLYPEEKIRVSVNLMLDGKLTCTYPEYNNGWTVTASPDGTLTDDKGQIYNYLYWEGETYTHYDLSKGFCVKGEDTAAFLENALDKLGLTRREANEFIVYWLPLMEQNPYNIISFQTDIYTEAAQLEVNPAPDTMIRVFMAWQAADSFVNLPEQELTAPERTGFSVVEWGGTEIK